MTPPKPALKPRRQPHEIQIEEPKKLAEVLPFPAVIPFQRTTLEKTVYFLNKTNDERSKDESLKPHQTTTGIIYLGNDLIKVIPNTSTIPRDMIGRMEGYAFVKDYEGVAGHYLKTKYLNPGTDLNLVGGLKDIFWIRAVGNNPIGLSNLVNQCLTGENIFHTKDFPTGKGFPYHLEENPKENELQSLRLDSRFNGYQLLSTRIDNQDKFLNLF